MAAEHDQEGFHGCEFDQDAEGFDFAVCSCGWQSPPTPGVDLAADLYGDHRAAVAIAHWEANR